MLNKLTQTETLADQAYREIKQAIIQGKFSPGDPLPEEAVASMLGISRTPLKKAITKLAYEGLVELKTGKIARVAEFTPKDIEDFLQLRNLLEPFSIEQICKQISDDEIGELDQILKDQRAAIEKNDLYEFIHLDADFHIRIARMNTNEKLQQFIEQLNNNLHRRYLILSNTLDYGSKLSVKEHERIIEALKNRDPEEASLAMKSHIQNVENRITNSELFSVQQKRE